MQPPVVTSLETGWLAGSTDWTCGWAEPVLPLGRIASTLVTVASFHILTINYSLAIPQSDAVSPHIPATLSHKQQIRPGREAWKMSPCGDPLKGRRVLALCCSAIRLIISYHSPDLTHVAS